MPCKIKYTTKIRSTQSLLFFHVPTLKIWGFLRQDFSMYPWLPWMSLCRPSSPQTNRDPPSFASPVLGLKTCATTAGIDSFFFPVRKFTCHTGPYFCNKVELSRTWSTNSFEVVFTYRSEKGIEWARGQPEARIPCRRCQQPVMVLDAYRSPSE